MEDKRKLRRARVLKSGTISFEGAAISCTVRDLTKSGAMLDVAGPLGIPREFALVIPSDDVRHACRIIWIKERRLGVRFERGDGGTEKPTKVGCPVRSSTVLMAAFFLSSILTNGPALSRSSMAAERPHAAEHIERLPADLRRGIVARERACGNRAAAGHYFSVSIVAGGLRFISLHFEEFVCANRASVCNASGCLHEVYLESGGRHRLVFSVRARDVKMTDGDAAGIEVNFGTSHRFFKWNGARFVPASAASRSR